MELETHIHEQIEIQLGFHELPNWKPTRVLWTTSFEMQLETHVHVQIEKQLGFHELQIACYHYGWQVCYGMLLYVSIVGYGMVY